MFEFVIYCILGLCILWDLGLVLYMMIESANDVAELKEICHRHARKEW